MLELLDVSGLVLENVENVLVLHELLFYVVLGVAAVAHLYAADDAFVVDLR